jgi:hypothetical protein
MPNFAETAAAYRVANAIRVNELLGVAAELFPNARAGREPGITKLVDVASAQLDRYGCFRPGYPSRTR